MASTDLSSLSPELICLILQRLHSGHDLYAFLQASSHVYRAYTASRDLILWHLAKRSMAPEVLVDAVTAVKLRNMECGFDQVQMKFDEFSALAVEHSLRGNFGKESLPHGLLSSADLLTLRQLQSAVEYFIHDYCSQKMPFPFTFSSARDPDLSPMELGRLQRAFYRYDICQTLWYYPGRFHDEWDYKTSRCEPGVLLLKTTPWEVEEVTCVWQYIHNHLHAIFDSLEEKLTNSIVSDSYKTQSQKDDLSIETPDKQDEISVRLRFDQGHSDFFFSEDGKIYQGEHITFLASRTLPFLRTLFESDTDQQRRLIFRYQQFHQDHLARYVNARLFLRQDSRSESNVQFSNFEVDLGGDRLLGRNLGWMWASASWSSAIFAVPCKDHLRDWGYVFWDKDRIERSGLMKTPRPGKMETPHHHPRRNHREEPRVEQRLKGKQ